MDLPTYARRVRAGNLQPAKYPPTARHTPLIELLLQRRRAADGGDRLEEEARSRARRIPLSPTRPGSAASPPAASTGDGAALPVRLREHFETYIGGDLSQVRIHADRRAAQSAAALGAKAFTLGSDISFAEGRYAPDTAAGQRLLAHELIHVAQQSRNHGGAEGSVATPKVTPSPHQIQCEDGEGGYQLRLSSLGPWWQQPQQPRFQLRIDPAIQAEIALLRMRYVQRILDPANVRSSIQSIDPAQILTTTPPDFMQLPTLPEPEPLVPAGAGPATPRAATPSDLLRGFMAIPAVDTALTRLRTQATARVERDWRRLSTGEQVLLVSQAVLIGGGALAGALSHPESRGFLLEQIQGRNIPVPLVPGLSFQFNATGPDQRLFFTLDLARIVAE